MKSRTFWEIIIFISIIGYLGYKFDAIDKYHQVKSYFINDSTEIVEPIVVHDTITTERVITKSVEMHEYTDSIPFIYKNKRIILTVYVNGIPIKGILDTGADDGLFLSVVEYEFFKRNGISVGNVIESTATGISGVPVKAWTGYLENIKIGTKTIPKINVSYCEVTGDDAENLFGIDIFNEKFTVDYQKNQIYLYK